MNPHMNPQTDPGMRPLRLYRSVDDRVIAGVAGGVAVYFGVDSAIVRIIWFISFFVTGSLTFWVYLIMIAVVPPEPADWPGQSPWAPGGQPLGFQTGYSAPSTGTYPGSYESPSAGTNPADPNSVPDAAAGSTPAGQTGFAAADATQGWGWRTQRDQERWQRRQERWQRRQERWQGYADRDERGGPGLVFGLLLILGGGILAWHQFDPGLDLALTWPVLIIALGAILVVSSFRARA